MSTDIQTKNNSAALANAGESTAAAAQVMEKFLSAANVSAVYGTPIEHGGTLVIPSAEILSASGFGLGSGGEGNESGSGGGGGGRVLSRPVAVIIAGPEGVRVEPVVDVTKIALAFFTAVGFMASMARRMKNGPKL